MAICRNWLVSKAELNSFQSSAYVKHLEIFEDAESVDVADEMVSIEEHQWNISGISAS